MKKYIFLIGIDHNMQHPGMNESTCVHLIRKLKIYKYKIHVKNTIRKLNVTLLAEEWSIQANKINHILFSTNEQIANDKKIKHLACDPTSDERKEIPGWLQMSNPEQFNQREIFWLNRLKDNINHHNNILFICGDNHIKSLKDKLENDKDFNFEIAIISTGWNSDPKCISYPEPLLN